MSRYDSQSSRIHSLQDQIEKMEKDNLHNTDTLKLELNNMKERLITAEMELNGRPPVDFSSLLESIAMVGGEVADGMMSNVNGYRPNKSGSGSQKEEDNRSVTHHNDSGTVTTRNSRLIPWKVMEVAIVDCIRRMSAEATHGRVNEQETMRKLRIATDEVNSVRLKLIEMEGVVMALERDLLSAHNAIDAGKALIKCYNQNGTSTASSSSSKSSMDIFEAVIAQHAATTAQEGKTLVVNTNTMMNNTHLGVGGVVGDITGEFNVNSEVLGEEEDVEKGSGGKGTAAVVLGGIDAGDRMLQAVLSQRDRFMKQAREKEQETSILRNRIEKINEEHIQLKNENLELFRRLRVVRAALRGQGPVSSSNVYAVEGDEEDSHKLASKNSRHRNKPGNGSDGVDLIENEYNNNHRKIDGAALDKKYMHLYEEKIDPFKMEEGDRQHMLSKMNIFERGLAHVTRFFLQDQWARHALLVYLILVHFFALGYVIQVLNPQLIEEVDTHMKSKWSMKTMDMSLEREHPDVRRVRF